MTYEVIEDRNVPGQWRVEAFDGDGACHLTIFCGPFAKQRARHYLNKLTAEHATSFDNLDKMQADIDAHATKAIKRVTPAHEPKVGGFVPGAADIVSTTARHDERVREVVGFWHFLYKQVVADTRPDEEATLLRRAEAYVQQREREEQK